MSHNELPVVEIHWVDSMGLPGWQNQDLMANCDMKVRTVGLLVTEDHESYTVSANQCLDNGQVDSPMKIPKMSVTDIWEIKYDT